MRARYVCDACSRKIKTKVISEDPLCSRCTAICRVELVDAPPRPGDDQVARNAMRVPGRAYPVVEFDDLKDLRWRVKKECGVA